jgi:glycosyltransferase involved in cell wall biosynthesis
MKIGIDACCWANKRGFGRFTRELMNAVVRFDKTNEYLFFADSRTAEKELFPAGIEVVKIFTKESPTDAAAADGRRSTSDLIAMSRGVRKRNLDIFFFPAVYSYFPIIDRLNTIVTIHDAIPEKHPREVFPNRRSQLFWKIKQYLAIKQANLILTVSEYSKKQITEYIGVPPKKIRVISEGPGSGFKTLPRDEKMQAVLEKYGLSCGLPYLLYVGGISPHKNIGALIEAFSKLAALKDHDNLKLVLVGDNQLDVFFSDYPNLTRQIERLHLGGGIIFTGFVGDDDLPFLYNSATAFVFPSFQEGFGLPAVEAMACGTPIIASRAGSLPEVVADAGIFFDPYSPEKLALIINEILLDFEKRAKMSAKGLERVKMYQWERAAGDLLSIFQELDPNRHTRTN